MSLRRSQLHILRLERVCILYPFFCVPRNIYVVENIRGKSIRLCGLTRGKRLHTLLSIFEWAAILLELACMKSASPRYIGSSSQTTVAEIRIPDQYGLSKLQGNFKDALAIGIQRGRFSLFELDRKRPCSEWKPVFCKQSQAK